MIASYSFGFLQLLDFEIQIQNFMDRDITWGEKYFFFTTFQIITKTILVQLFLTDISRFQQVFFEKKYFMKRYLLSQKNTHSCSLNFQFIWCSGTGGNPPPSLLLKKVYVIFFLGGREPLLNIIDTYFQFEEISYLAL